jgi:transposase
VQAVVLHDDGRVRHRERFACTRQELERFAQQHLGPSARVALEATTNTWSIVEVLRPLVHEVVVSNPLRTRAIAEAKIKTDKVDALVLVQLLRADFLPRVWAPDVATQARRRETGRHAALVSDRTRIKNRLHAVLHQRLIAPPVDQLFSHQGLAWLASVDLDPAGRTAVESELRLVRQVEAELASIDETLAIDGYDDPRVRLLMTLPGVDVVVAQTLLAALGDIHRFRDADHAASYLGLVPSTRQSAEHCYHGPITKQGQGQARWMLIQAAQHLGTQPGPLGVFFRRLATKKNRNVAVVAAARKLVTIAWHMLKNNEPYRYAVPSRVEAKLRRLRVRATGQRRRSGPKKGQKRSSAYGTGQRYHTIPALQTVYQREGLPAMAPLREGELRMLRERKVLKHVHQSRNPQCVPRHCPQPDPPPPSSATKPPQRSPNPRTARKGRAT